MVSVIASKIRNRREYRELCDLFEMADSSGDGRVDLQEFLTVCKQYGIEVSQDEVSDFTSISVKGEVNTKMYLIVKINLCIGHQD